MLIGYFSRYSWNTWLKGISSIKPARGEACIERDESVALWCPQKRAGEPITWNIPIINANAVATPALFNSISDSEDNAEFVIGATEVSVIF